MKNIVLKTPTIILVLFLFLALSITNFQNTIANDYVTPTQTNSEPRTFQVLEYTFEQAGSGDFVGIDNWKTIIQRENPDIIMATEASHWDPSDGSFQESIKEINSWFPNEIPYQGVATIPASATDGQAILSRFPIISYTIIDNTFTLDDGSNFDISHKVMDAVVDIYGLETHLVTSHFTCCGQGYAKRLQEQEALMNYFDDLGDVPIIYSGDFNSESPLDVGDLRPPYSTLTGDAADIIVNSSNPKASVVHDFTDVFRTLNPYDPGPTFLSNVYVSRIDHMYVNNWLVDYMAKSYVVDSYEEATRFNHIPLVGIFNADYATTDIKAPTTPHDLTAEVDIQNVKSTLSWATNAETDLFKYQVYRNVSSFRCLITEIPKTETSFIDNYLYELDTIYKYEMTSVDELGNISPISNSIYINSSQSQVFRPGQPVLTAEGISGGIQLNWTLPDNGGSDEITYVVRRASDITADPIITTTTGETSYFYSVPGAPAGTPIFFWVIATNFVGDSIYSEMATATTVAINSNLNLLKSGQVVDHPTNFDSNNITLHQSDVCPDPINLLDLPVQTTTSESSSSTETSKKDDTPLSIGIISIFTVNLIIAKVLLRKKN